MDRQACHLVGTGSGPAGPNGAELERCQATGLTRKECCDAHGSIPGC